MNPTSDSPSSPSAETFTPAPAGAETVFTAGSPAVDVTSTAVETPTPIAPPEPPDAPTPHMPQVSQVPPAPLMKFYHAMNCNRRIAGVLFKVYGQIAGTFCGTHATSSPEEIAALDKLVEAKANVTEMIQSEYEALVKKKVTTSEHYTPLVTPHASLRVEQHQIISRPGAQLVENPSPDSLPKPPATSEPLASASDAINVGKVKS